MSGDEESKDPGAIQLDAAEDAVLEPNPPMSAPPSSLARKTPPPLPPASLSPAMLAPAPVPTPARSGGSRAMYVAIILGMLVVGGGGGLLFANYLRGKAPPAAVESSAAATAAPTATASAPAASAQASAASTASSAPKGLTLPEVEIK